MSVVLNSSPEKKEGMLTISVHNKSMCVGVCGFGGKGACVGVCGVGVGGKGARVRVCLCLCMSKESFTCPRAYWFHRHPSNKSKSVPPSTTEAPLEFTIPLSEQICKEGETVTFFCEVTESSVPAKWFKNGVELQPSEAVSIEMEGKVHRLVLKEAQLDDTAEYTVVIKDKSSSAKLTVQGEFVLWENSFILQKHGLSLIHI